MNILITGGNGFIGSHLTEELLNRGYDVTSLDVNNKNRIKEFIDNPHYKFIKGDVLDSNLVDSLIKESDIVFHLASICVVEDYLNKPAETIMINVNGTFNVLNSALKYSKKVVYASTSEIYGKSLDTPFKEDGNRVLGPTKDNRWSYSTSKACAEHLCFSFIKRGLICTIVRYFNVYGPKLDKFGEGRVVSSMIGSLIRDNCVCITSEGKQTRSFIYIDDAIKATINAGLFKEADNKVINIGSSDEISIRELADKILSLSEKVANIKSMGYEELYGSKYEDIPKRVPNNSLMIKVLKIKPKVSLEEGLKRTYNWFLKNKENNELEFIELEITRKCNLNCKYCYIGRKSQEYMDMKVIKKILKEAKLNSVDRIILTGGEPSLHPDFLEIVKYALEINLKVGILTKSIFEKEKLKPFLYKINFIQYGVDMPLNKSKITKKIINEIKWVKENRGTPTILVTLHKKNIHFFESFLELNKFALVGFQRLLITDNSFKELDVQTEKWHNLLKKAVEEYLKNPAFSFEDPLFNVELLKRLEFSRNELLSFDVYGCSAARKGLYIDVKGNAFPCAKMRVNDMNVINNGLINSWENSKIFNTIRKKNNMICQNCNFLSVCGGCIADSWILNKTLTDLDSKCIMN